MMTNTGVVKTTTYQQLGDVLAELGFQKRVMPQFTAYQNASFKALIVLPQETSTERVRPPHLAAARATVLGKGVATADVFDRLLERVSRNSLTPDVSAEKSLPLTGPKKRARKSAASAALAISAVPGE